METFKMVVLVFGAFFCVLLTFSFCFAIFRGAPFVPTSRQKVRRMLTLANLKKDEKLVDLGSGDGRFVLAAARRGAQAVGLELNWFLVAWARLQIQLAHLGSSASIMRSSVFNADLREVDVVVCYLSPEMNKKLQSKLERELKPGARVLTHTFSFGEWEPTVKEGGVFVYTMGK